MVEIESWFENRSTDATFTDTDYRGMSFTIGTTAEDNDYTLTDVEVRIKKNGSPTDDITAEIFAVDSSGLPTGTPLATTTIDHTNVTGSLAWVKFDMDNIKLERSTQYALVVKMESYTNPNAYQWAIEETLSTYTGGNVVRTQNGGSTWVNNSGEDFWFKINGILFVPNTTGGAGSKWIRRSYPFTSGLTPLTTKQEGRDPDLGPPELERTALKKEYVGL